jgi:hypothetical protein
LLDEAIREHLELKRRQGADPGEIARKEKEALAPVVPNEPDSWGGDPSPLSHEAESDVLPNDGEVAQPEQAVEATHQPDFSTVGQETAELDMQAVLDADGFVGDPAPAGYAGTVPVRAAHTDRATGEDPLEREGSDDEHVIHEIPGQERLSFE